MTPPPPAAGNRLYSLEKFSLQTLNGWFTDFYANLWKFMTTSRTREEMAIRMETCNCERSDRTVDEFHKWQWLDVNAGPGLFAEAFVRWMIRWPRSSGRWLGSSNIPFHLRIPCFVVVVITGPHPFRPLWQFRIHEEHRHDAWTMA